MPSRALCTDNAAMIAYTGWLLGNAGYRHDLRMETVPRGKSIPDDMLCAASCASKPCKPTERRRLS